MIPIQQIPDDLQRLLERGSFSQNFNDEGVISQVKTIVDAVRNEGDQALVRFSHEFDGVELTPDKLRVTGKEIENAYQAIDEKFLEALQIAKDRIYSYHLNQKTTSWFVTEEDGVTLGQLIQPIERVGLYVPGGLASYPSSVLMNALPAKVAGVDQIIMCTPPSSNGEINPHTLVAASQVGVDEIYKIGGAQAIAALAFGTDTIGKVYKIVGPGNIFVTVAKKMVVGDVDIDVLAGPSEVLIIADDKANPDYIAADMLGQAEHAPDAISILITTSSLLADQVAAAISHKLNLLQRKEIAAKSIENNGMIFIAPSLDAAITASNSIAPEHLELMLADPFSYLSEVKSAGAIFMGSYTPEVVGDYIAGPNHVLPTGGTAHFHSSLGVYDFVKRLNVLSYTKAGLKKVGREVEILAEAEGFDAHAKSIKERLNYKE